VQQQSDRLTCDMGLKGSQNCCGRLVANEGTVLSWVIELWMFRSKAEGSRRIHLAADRKLGIVVNMTVKYVSHEMAVVILDWEENCWFLLLGTSW
jgi:hypothetical protein